MMTSTNLSNLRRTISAALAPPPDLTLDQYSDTYRVLPKSSSAEHGLWRTSRFPFLREIMYELSPQAPSEEVAVMKGAQLGLTEVSLNLILYTIDYNPLPMLYIQKTVDAVEKFSKQRVQKSVELMPSIKAKLGTTKSRDSSNTIRLKAFPGGILILGGANSAASLRSTSIGLLVIDEWDSFEGDIQDEGDPAELAIRRTANFPRRKIYYLSTPVLKETSRIEPKFLAGDQRFYYVPCRECGHKAPIMWSTRTTQELTNEEGETQESDLTFFEKYKPFTITYHDNKGKLENVGMVCAECGCIIPERYKTWFLAEENGAEWIKHNPRGRYPSFHVSSLYSPLGFYSWEAAIQLWLKATKTLDRTMLKVFVNTVLGECFSEAGKIVESSGLHSRREIYNKPVPRPVGILICGADVQDNRIEAELVGFGKSQESWSIDYKVFTGDTEGEQVWNDFDNFLCGTWEHENGLLLNISLALIDARFHTRKVKTFCRLREHRRVFPVQGKPGWGKGLIKRPTRRDDDGTYTFTAYVDELKNKLYSQLKVQQPGPMFCHFPKNKTYNENYFRMLTAEKLIRVRKNGVNSLKWDLPSGRRNEALDVRCYALAGLNIANPNFDVIESRGGPKPVTYAKKRKTRKRHSKGIRLR